MPDATKDESESEVDNNNDEDEDNNEKASSSRPRKRKINIWAHRQGFTGVGSQVTSDCYGVWYDLALCDKGLEDVGIN